MLLPDYDDNLEHSIWLGMMYPRLKLLRELLTEDGVIFVQIDDSPNSKAPHSPEMAYLSVLIDEIFGRRNYDYYILYQSWP
ncbi:MAG: DNA methyltransferase [Alphaproteobacteria bacterium]